MRRDEEEILIRDDSGLLYDDSVTVSVRPRPGDGCHKINKTLCLALGFFVMVRICLSLFCYIFFLCQLIHSSRYHVITPDKRG